MRLVKARRQTRSRKQDQNLSKSTALPLSNNYEQATSILNRNETSWALLSILSHHQPASTWNMKPPSIRKYILSCNHKTIRKLYLDKIESRITIHTKTSRMKIHFISSPGQKQLQWQVPAVARPHSLRGCATNLSQEALPCWLTMSVWLQGVISCSIWFVWSFEDDNSLNALQQCPQKAVDS